MRRLFLFFLFGLLSSGALAQQVICERTFGQLVPATGSPNFSFPGTLGTVGSDSVLMPVVTASVGLGNNHPLRLALVWLNAQCDTTTFALLDKGSSYYYSAVFLSATKRRVLALSNIGLSPTNASSRYQLQSFTRQGVLRWTQAYTLRNSQEVAESLVEAPGQGVYLTSGMGPPGSLAASTRLTRVDSAGNTQWQRVYRDAQSQLDFTRPCYTVRGNLLLAGTRTYSTVNVRYGQVLEVNQRGDTLASRDILRRPNVYTSLLAARPLRDGGFLLVGELDSALYHYPFYVRLDANLTTRWSYVYRQVGAAGQPNNQEIGRGMELADGTLLGVVSIFGAPIRFLRFSATGTLLTTYRYTPAVPSYNYSLVPLAADSSFVLASNLYSTVGHLRIPGLPRVLPWPPVPLAQVFLAARPPAPAWPAPAYPNPAASTVTVPYRLPTGCGEARLILTDLAGRRVRTQAVVAGPPAAQLGLGGLAPGVYLLTLEAEGQPPATQRLAIGQ